MLLEQPALALHEETDRVRMLRAVAIGTMIVATLFMVVIAIEQPGLAGRAFTAAVVIDGLGLTALAIGRRNRPDSGSWVLVVGLMLLIAIFALGAGGIRSPGVGAYLVIVLMAGLLLGERNGLLVGAACAGIGFLLVVAEVTGVLPPRTVEYSSTSLWVLACLYIAVTVVLQRLASRTMRSAMARASAELATRKAAASTLAERVKELRLLHVTTQLLQGGQKADRALLSELADMIPRAWQHNAICEVRVCYRDIEVTTPRWRTTPWMQAATVSTSGGACSIEVAYLEERPTADEGPFLKEERALLESIAAKLGAHIERECADEGRRIAEDHLRQSQKMEALGRLAGGVAHDFNNLLTVIQGYSELLLAGPADESQRRDISEISSAAMRASQLTRQLLAFSRKQVLSPRVLQVNDVVRGMDGLLRRLISSDIELRVVLDERTGPVHVDPGQLEQVIMNLVVNARDAMPQGGVLTIQSELTEFAEEVALEKMQLPSGRYAMISVSDTGTGIPPEVRSRIFEPFFTTKDEGRGTGLGLATVLGIVQQSLGAVMVYSEPSEGSTFKVYLPCVDEVGTVDRVVAPVLRPAGGSESIVLVDDDPQIRALAERSLVDAGYAVTAFTDSTEALAHLESMAAAPDIVVTDVVMPRIRGPELAALIRGKWPEIRILYVTGYSDRVIEPGKAPHVVMKPFTPSSLSRAVRDVLDSAKTA